ncbi:MAG: ferritin family protein [Deltaproteobacteria bacterium]
MSKYPVEKILKHAMEIEEAGQKFYAMLAERLDDAPLKKIFTVMSRQETGHYEVYKQLHDQLPAVPEAPAPDAEPFDYKKHELLEDRIFNRLDVVRKTARINTLGDALVFMIDTEMDVVDYFENARRLVNLQGQDLMEKIINEEKTHVKQLVDLRHHYKTVILK